MSFRLKIVRDVGLCGVRFVRRFATQFWKWAMEARITREQLHHEMLKDRWQDLLYGVDADKLTYDEAVEMYEKLRYTPMMPKRRDD